MVFSVIVPFLNEEPYIERCIRSLLNQDFDKIGYELIFVDNGSEDRSAEIVRNFPEVKLVYEKIKNVEIARNRGVGLARGEILAFTDADCTVSPRWLTEIYEGMTKNNAAIVLGRRSFPPDSSFALQLLEDYENAKIEYVLTYCHAKHYFGFTNNMALKHNFFKKGSLSFNSAFAGSGDTAVVHQYLSNYPDAKVAYLPKMKICHLEVKNAGFWLKKISSYGEHNRNVREKYQYIDLDYNKKLSIHRYCAEKNGYGLVKKVFFFLLLIIGDLFYEGGRMRGYIKKKIFRRYCF